MTKIDMVPALLEPTVILWEREISIKSHINNYLNYKSARNAYDKEPSQD